MKRRELLSAIRAAKGPMFATVVRSADVGYVRVTKAALVELIDDDGTDGETGYRLDEIDGRFYLDSEVAL